VLAMPIVVGTSSTSAQRTATPNQRVRLRVPDSTALLLHEMLVGS
jgi:hypothetical protein